YAHRIAEISVQQNDVTRLTEGLVALALGSDKIDPRDAVSVFSLLAHSAVKLGAEPEMLFRDAGELGGGEYAFEIQNFLNRDDVDRSIHEMGFKESNDGQDFKYVRHSDF